MLWSKTILKLIVLLMPLNLVADNGDSLAIGPRFHFETSFGDTGFKGENLTWGKNMPLYKRYKNAKKITLPPPDFEGMVLEKAIRERQSIRSFTGKALTMLQLSRLLQSAGGITHSYDGYDFRAAPSGGALYPIEIYVVATNVESLTRGIYHFQVSDSTLELMKEGDFRDSLYRAGLEQSAIAEGAINIVITSLFPRITKKYADRGYRYAYMEAGAICQNIYLQATSLGLGTVVMGAFNDDAVNRLLEIDGQDEAALMIMPVGSLP